MARKLFIAIALVWIGTLGRGQATASACAANSSCAEYWEFCKETAEYWDGEYKECCEGVCRGPFLGINCNNDYNQCRCYFIQK